MSTMKYEVGQNDSRPWGRWEVIALGEDFIIKEIVVTPGAQLSLQSHEHRSEHWTVLTGTAAVTIGDEIVELNRNGTVFIDAHTKHRIQNTGENELRFIEIQTGAVLDESDIVRYEDNYGRA